MQQTSQTGRQAALRDRQIVHVRAVHGAEVPDIKPLATADDLAVTPRYRPVIQRDLVVLVAAKGQAIAGDRKTGAFQRTRDGEEAGAHEIPISMAPAEAMWLSAGSAARRAQGRNPAHG